MRKRIVSISNRTLVLTVVGTLNQSEAENPTNKTKLGSYLIPVNLISHTRNTILRVKNGFGKVFQIFIFLQVIYKSIENSSLLLKLQIFSTSPDLQHSTKHQTQRSMIQKLVSSRLGKR
jgi:hypothetical protein